KVSKRSRRINSSSSLNGVSLLGRNKELAIRSSISRFSEEKAASSSIPPVYIVATLDNAQPISERTIKRLSSSLSPKRGQVSTTSRAHACTKTSASSSEMGRAKRNCGNPAITQATSKPTL